MRILQKFVWNTIRPFMGLNEVKADVGKVTKMRRNNTTKYIGGQIFLSGNVTLKKNARYVYI